MAELARAEGARMIFVPTLGPPIQPLADARALGSLMRIIGWFRPQILHSHTAKAGLLARTAALAAPGQRPILVHTYHGHVLEGYFGPSKTQVFRTLERALGRRSDRLIGVSEATVDDLVRLGVAPREKFEVVRLGLDLAKYDGVGREQGVGLRRDLGLSEGDVLAVFVGRVVPIKRLDVLLKALAIARGREARLHLAVVGDGEITPDLERLATEVGVREVTHFLGYQRDLVPIFAASDLAVISSDNEGTPVSLIEAGAASRPAVATDVGGVSDVVTPESGRLVPPGDEHGLGVALAELAGDDELRARMGESARGRIMRAYSADRLVADIEALYGRLAEQRGGCGRS